LIYESDTTDVITEYMSWWNITVRGREDKWTHECKRAIEDIEMWWRLRWDENGNEN